MRRQGGWAALLPLGLIAILGTSGAIVATEQVAGVADTGLLAMAKGERALREGKVTVEPLETQQPAQGNPAPLGGK